MGILPENSGEPLFENYLLAKGLMKRTIEEYLFYLKGFLSELGTVELNQDFLNKYLGHSNYVQRAFITNYLKFIERKDLTIPKITGKANKKKQMVRYISKEDINKIAMEFDKTADPIRNKLMLAISFQGALRESELLGISVNDCKFKEWFEDRTKPLTIIIFGKGNKERPVYVSSDIAHILLEYIEVVKSKLSFGENENTNFYLFSNKGNGIGARRWRQLLALASKRAFGEEHIIHPHMLRHSFAMYAKDTLRWTLEQISNYLGHSSLQVTTIYAKTTNPELKNAFDVGFNQREIINQPNQQYP